MAFLVLFISLRLSTAAHAESFRFVVLSDTHLAMDKGVCGLDSRTGRAVKKIAGDMKPRFVIHCGDMITACPGDSEENILSMGDVFRRGVVDKLKESGIGFFPAPGNHDVAGRGRELYGRVWKGFSNRGFRLDAGDYTQSYAFHYGNSLFVSLDRSSGDMGERDVGWLRGLLERSRSRFRHVFVFCHVGLLGSEDKLSERPVDRELEGVLERNGVDYFISGHYHVGAEVKVGKTRHIICGALNTYPYEFLVFTVDGESVKWESESAERTALPF
ncbi:MAG: metallophosphoesterase [Candidatus Eremiobacteraeota bacterium]|nr:metallophosphoesterase [Candidatus Eremiobacteraeota bacterium]